MLMPNPLFIIIIIIIIIIKYTIIYDTVIVKIDNFILFAEESDVECSRNVSFDKDVFKHVNVEETGVGAVKFLKPLNLECNYFECEIISTGIHDSVGIGVGEYEYPLDKMPGWLRKGVGYHDDGYIFNEGNAQDKLGPTCTKGDKMGCGVEFIDDAEYVIVFFTKNGEQIGDVILFNIPTSGLYSLIGMYNEGEQVRYLGHSQRGLPINLLKVSLN